VIRSRAWSEIAGSARGCVASEIDDFLSSRWESLKLTAVGVEPVEQALPVVERDAPFAPGDDQGLGHDFLSGHAAAESEIAAPSATHRIIITMRDLHTYSLPAAILHQANARPAGRISQHLE
jgi:hypothetical protein